MRELYASSGGDLVRSLGVRRRYTGTQRNRVSTNRRRQFSPEVGGNRWRLSVTVETRVTGGSAGRADAAHVEVGHPQRGHRRPGEPVVPLARQRPLGAAGLVRATQEVAR